MNSLIKYLLLSLFLSTTAVVQGQSLSLQAELNGKIRTKKFGTRKLMLAYLNKELSTLHTQGFLEASFDTTKTDSSSWKAVFQTGKKYTWEKLTLKKDEKLKRVNTPREFNAHSVQRIAEKLIREKENSGFPFTSVQIDSIVIQDSKVSANLKINEGKFYRIDSVLIKGQVKVPKIYIYRYLGIKPGDPYNEKLIASADKRLREIPFLSPIKPVEVMFTRNQSLLYLYLKKRNASSFNGIIGILPDAATGKTTITGDARINLKNAAGFAESFDLNWRKIANKTQDLKLNLSVPFLFSTPIGTDLNFKLFKRDTSFLEINRGAGLSWQLNRGNYFKVFYNRYNSDVLAKSVYTVGSTNLLNADVSINQYGIGIRFEQLDYRINPRKGFTISSDASAGIKSIQPNAANDATIYSNEKLKTEYYTGFLQAELYLPLLQSFAFRIANNTRFIVNEKIYKNELLRIGGIKTLRGFDEESIFASAYSISSIEYRFLFDENSNLFAFYDWCWYENTSSGSYAMDMPYGMGAGVNFQVKSGVFSFTWALGSQQNNPILFKNSKIHFGFINYF